MENVFCPVCSSELKPLSYLNYNAPIDQRVNCPVCTFPVGLVTGYPFPQQYTGFQVVNYVAPRVSWKEVQEQAAKSLKEGDVSALTSVPPSTSVLDQFSVSEALKSSANATGDVLGSVLNTAGKAVGSGVQGLFSGLGTPIVIGIVILVVVFFLMKD